MKHSLAILSLLAIFFAANVFAQDSLQLSQKKQYRYKSQSASMNGTGNQSKGFVDANGDGFNDNALDADGDGIPNGQDADYTGAKSGDGIPNGQDADYVKPADGTGRMNKGGQGKGGNGSGLGTGTGDCDGTGPKGNGKRGGK